MEDFNEELGVALLSLYMADKYLYNVAARLRIQHGDTIPHMPEVRGYTDGVRIYFTDAWMHATKDQRLGTLTHEVLHVISKHLLRIKGVEGINHLRMNVAADISIAAQQVQLGQKPPILDINPDWNKWIGMDMFEIYNLLEPEDSQHDLGHPIMGYGGEDDFDLSGATQEEEFQIDQAIQQAAQQAEAEGYSTDASRSASRLIDEMNAKAIPWNHYLAQVTSKLKSDVNSWARPNRRMMSQVYLPSRTTKDMYEATMAMDVSGSVGQVPLNIICATAQDLLTKYVENLHLLTFDDKIVDEWNLNRKDKIVDLELNGYGGTYVQKVYDHLEELKVVPKLLIIATDGYIPDTPDPGYRVVWLIVDNPTFKCNYGTILHINTREL